ncbi:MAG: NADH-quinone oxidoreductase subunit F [Streptococcaceae bacterium]|jgi:NADH-quinone oxidoreductase subunit F|nr:NADH-quinone oxidoreductase subunit F [Streptococcaceae bacterium]
MTKILTQNFDKITAPTSVEEYESFSGYAGLKKAMTLATDEVLEEINTALLRGRGGAAFPMGRKWGQFVSSESDVKYIVCNGDEGEPGTFKDGMLLDKTPLAIIEGMTIAAWISGAHEGYILIRGEYRAKQDHFNEALENARKANYLGKAICGHPDFNFDIKIISGAGAYICGESSALVNTIMGKTGRPRVKPPHLAEVGLYLKPTLINNVESYSNVPYILREGGQKFLDLGTADGGGTKIISLTGHIKHPGNYEVELGTPLHEILYSQEYGGGSATGRPLKFIHFGGQSGPIGAVSRLEDTLYSYDGLWDANLAIGSGAIVVMDDSVSVIDYLVEVARFFRDESCGKCTPCRIGSLRILEMLERFAAHDVAPGELETFEKMCANVRQLSLCGLGQSIPVSMTSALKDFPEEFAACVNENLEKVEVAW